MVAAYILQSVVSNYLWSVARDWIVDRTGHFDFVIEKDCGQIIAIEVLATLPSSRKLKHVSNAVVHFEGALRELLLVTEIPPAQSATERFATMLKDSGVPHRWISINELPGALGLKSREICFHLQRLSTCNYRLW